ncbi:hypothetical protein HZH66_013979 [Vespula vulgaris]|uniref:Uncharacterized protein n=1 Tax=Vespula vulgaris TaxID=7454 RepID=A0A834MQP0_VESVU|nr:hypothetical protein HZH66_013979 [Vespula vulgaris]
MGKLTIIDGILTAIKYTTIPDLNPIEYLWYELDQKIFVKERYSKLKLITILKKTWSEISSDVLKKYILSMLNHLSEVTKAKCYHTSY